MTVRPILSGIAADVVTLALYQFIIIIIGIEAR